MRVYPFPTLKQSFGVKKIIDVRQLMEDWKPLGNPIATYLERPIGSRDVKAARGMQDAFATVRSLLKLLGCHTVYITPQSWQKTYCEASRGRAGVGHEEDRPQHCQPALPRSEFPSQQA